MQQSLAAREDTRDFGHESDAPSEPDHTDEEGFYDVDDPDAAPLDGVGTFGAAVPSGAELCRTHLLECVTAEVFNPDNPSRSKTATIFFDCGSSKTFVFEDFATDLGLINLGRKELILDTFANDKPVKLDTFETKIGLLTTKRERIVLDAAASPRVVRQLRTAFIKPEDVRELRRNKCILVPEYVAPDIVIGRDKQHLFRKRDIFPALPSGFCLVKSTLGTMVAGLGSVPKTTGGTPSAFPGSLAPRPYAPPGNSQEVGTVSLSSFFASSTERMAENFWKTENIGIAPNTRMPDDQLAHERFQKTTTVDEEGRYQCRLPWKTPDGMPPSNVVLPTNHGLARGRLTSFQRAHIKQPEFLLKYGEGFTTLEELQVIEKFDPTERNSAPLDLTLHLLAHHAVIKESSATTKVRHVFDGSAHLPGKPSINDSLYRGPVLLPKMASILIRTRLSQLLLIADIAKAFHQVSLHPDDRSACAFLWLKDPLKEPTDDNLIYYRFRRVPFGLKPSPFLLGATIEMHLNKIGTPLAKEIWSSCYVDNVILGADTLEEALEKYHLSKEYFASAKMILRQFASNCSQFNAQLPPEDAAELRNLMNLGYEWDVASDCWRISLAAKAAKGKPKGRQRRRPAEVGVLTKRQMLQRLARITDPIGYLQPTLLPVKLAIQEAWKVDADWNDEPVPAALLELWEEATKDFNATTIEIPRRISSTRIEWLEVHIYVDASKEAYGFATYLRVPAEGHYSTSLVFSRTKVKPLKDAERMTIPRMELMAFLLGARQARFMAETLELSMVRRTIIWSDSMIVLQQIRTPDKSKEVFVENRLAEIRALQAELRFETRYVNTAENPADLVSRGLPAAELATCDLWWHASPFLLLDEAEWPAQPTFVTPSPVIAEDHAETKPTDTSAAQPSGSTTALDGTPSGTVASVWDSTQEGTPSSEVSKGCCGSFRFYTILKRWRTDHSERLLAASALQNPLDHAEQGASPPDITIPGFVSFFNANACEPNPIQPPTAILYDDPPTNPEDPTPKWLQIRTLNVTWSKVQRIYFYILRAVGAFLRLRNLGNSPRTPLGIDFTRNFASKCSHAAEDGIPSVHAFCGERLYTASDMHIAAATAIWQAQKAHPPTKLTRKQLQIVEFHGLLYVKGRLDRSSLASTTITPLYLPRESILTDLIIYDYHRANLHAGVTTTLANVRVRYWFAHGRRTVANAIKRRCFECRKMTNPAYSIPPWPALPTTRTELSRPFSCVGIDFFGPVMLKPMNLDGTPSKDLRKYYVCLFTCLSIRAVHCELMNDLSTAQFFHVFKRFTARRSYPSEVLSDNGATFLAARQTIRSLLSARQRTALAADVNDADPAASPSIGMRKSPPRSSKRQQRGNSLVSELAASDDNLDAADELFHYFTANNITWRTITERAAWKGGVYERMIGLIKTCLSKTLGRTRPSVDDYRTLLAQAEWVVNCRPISYIANSERDFTL
ncbi:Pao retrotransposon peptidase family protein, partial [Aphelenchoides avenae]